MQFGATPSLLKFTKGEKPRPRRQKSHTKYRWKTRMAGAKNQPILTHNHTVPTHLRNPEMLTM